MEFDTTKTAIAFLLLNVVGAGALIGMDVMPLRIIGMMVVPSMLLFSGIFLFIGMKFGEHRATH